MEIPAVIRARAVDGVRPMRTLWLLSIAHAVNHAQAAVLPLVYLAIIHDRSITADAAAFAYLTAFANFASGMFQASYGAITRVVSRRAALGIGGIVFGGGMAAQAFAGNFASFAAMNILSRLGGSPQHPVGNALLAEQFPPRRRGFAISAHIAGGNVGTLAVPLLGAWLIAGLGWRITVVLFGVPAILIALAFVALVRESGDDRAAARAHGSVRSAWASIARDRDLVLLYLSSVLGGGGRGLGVLNLFVPLYLSLVIGLDTGTVAVMYTVLLIGSVPAPLVAGWLSDRIGQKPVIVGVYLAGAAALALLVLAGSNMALLWLAIVLLSTFSFVESPQLQALLADITPPATRDVTFGAYFTLAFGVGSLWTAVYGAVLGSAGNAVGLPIVFWLMAIASVAAAFSVWPIRASERTAAQAARDAETPDSETPDA